MLSCHHLPRFTRVNVTKFIIRKGVDCLILGLTFSLLVNWTWIFTHSPLHNSHYLIHYQRHPVKIHSHR